MPMSRLSRLARIIQVCRRHRLDTFLDSEQLPEGWQRFLRWLPVRWRPEPVEPRALRLRRALEELGPIFIKFGQLLSTRRDLIPSDLADELSRLQDNVPPFAASEARAIVERALGKPVNELFACFEAEPLASASVAQVHAATLFDGREVVVKVVRPGIERTIRQDVRLLYALARLVRRFHPDGRRLRPLDVVRDYEQIVLDELDLQREAANTSQLRRNFLDSDLLYVPEVHWDYTRRNVFVMERIHGIPVSDIEALHRAGVDMKELAERGVRIFFTQVFRDSLFHADMHPGNIFVDVSNPAKPRYIGIDCAIMGSLSDFDQYYLARNLLGIFQRRYREVAELHVECGWVPPQTRVHDFEAAIRSACEPIFGKPLGEIGFAQLLVYLFQTARRFDMEIQPSLVLLQKTLLHIEGLGRQLYPDLDLWETAKPFLEQWVSERYSPRGLIERLQKRAPHWLELLPEGPERLLELLRRATSPPDAPRATVAPAASPPWHRGQLLAGIAGLLLVEPRFASVAPLDWHPAAWVFVALAIYALSRRNIS
ncbi:MAG: ubiquinone biosynthesis regulatory protein kinase UbiB [Pseudomonadales bacterium]|nr:ubiquinone biosynthesis regulatory protein kinase UbiB [Pseudomonadales bacterium]MCP5322215.1 ubiquinone biosynthesis regulatory protein kinase UbiB [Pseudomonadales bacterium]MCP5337101.1 ubiquinone biosynthesis regulatory protein kinase UbiB [Pseudomonadales bacterium]